MSIFEVYKVNIFEANIFYNFAMFFFFFCHRNWHEPSSTSFLHDYQEGKVIIRTYFHISNFLGNTLDIHVFYIFLYCFFYLSTVNIFSTVPRRYQKPIFHVFMFKLMTSWDLGPIWVRFQKIVKVITAKHKLHLFFYKQSIFEPRPENCSSFSEKLPQKTV